MKAPALDPNESATYLLLRPLRWTILQRYGLAVLSVGIALGVGLLLEHFHFRVPSALLLLFAVALSSWRGGRGPAVLAAILSIIAFYWYFVEPVRTIRIYSSEIPYLITFISFAALLSWFGTIRRRVEADLREQAALLNLTHDTVFVMDLEGVIKYWNRGAEEQYGWTAEQALGRGVHDLLQTVFRAPLEEIKAKLTRSGRWEGEILHTRKDGTQVVVASRWALQRGEQGAPVAILETSNDITERKRAEERVQQQQIELQQIQDTTPQLIAVFGTDRKRLYDNRPSLDYFGVGLEEWRSIPDRFWFFHADDRERVARDVYTGPTRDDPHEFEARLRRRDGVYRWFLFRDNPLRDEQGRVMRWYLTATDIEDRKRAEEERQAQVRFLESMDRINRAMQGTNDLEQMTGDVIQAMLSIFDSERAFLYYPCDPNAPSFEVVMERHRGEYPGARGVIPMTPDTARGFQMVRASKGVVTFGPGCDHPLIGDFVERFGHKSSMGIALYPKTGKPWVLAMHQYSYPRVWTPDEKKLLEEIARRVTDSLTGLLMLRSLRESEQALRQSEAYLAEAQRLAHTGSWAWDPGTDAYAHWSEEMFRIFGFDPRDGLPTREAVFRKILPEDRNRVEESFQKSRREKVDTNDEYRIALPDGTVKYIHMIRHPILNEAGDLVKLVGTSVDITERKQAEQALQGSEGNLNRAQEIAHIGSWHLDTARNQLTWSNEVYRIFGRPRDEALTYEAFLDMVYSEDREGLDRAWAAALQGAPYDIEHRILAGDELKWVRERAEVEFDPQGNAVSGIGTVQDITERKRVEEELRESEMRFRTFVDHATDAFFLIGDHGRVLDVNRQACESLGYTREELIGITTREFDTNAEDVFLQWIGNRLDTGVDCTFETHHRRKDGTLFPVEVRARPLWRGGRRLSLCLARDITERKRAEEALRQSEAYLAETQRLSHTGSFAFDLASNKYIYVSEECFRIFEMDAQEGLPNREAVSRLIHPEDWDRVRADFGKSLREKVDASSEFRIVLPSGTVKHIQAIRHPVMNGAGDVVELVGTVIDMTERRRAEEALRLSNAYNRSLIETSLDPLVTIGPDGKVTDVNAATEAATGRSRSELIGTDFCDYFTEPAQARAGYEQAFREGLVRDYPLELRHRDGRVMSVLYNASVYRDESDQVSGVFAAARDITERQRAEEALRESEVRFRTFVDHAADAFFMLDFEQGTIIDVNRCACESLGYIREELIGMNPMAFDVDLDRAAVESTTERAAAGETVLFDRHWHRRKDGTLFPVEVQTSVFWHGGRRFLLKIARDISDRLRAEQQRDRLRQLEADLAHINRVSMMGELAASVAHEVNQPLSGVVSNASAGLRWLAGDVPNLEEAREGLRRIVRDGKRAGEVIARIRALTRKAATPTEKLDLNETIGEVLALIGDEARRKSVIVRTQFADDLSPVSGDRVQLQQVVLNLVMNAIEAMSVVDERARELGISTRNSDPGQVHVTVQDSGTGIDPQTIDRIFDSFYTTKPGGMGMGLSISRSILQAHGGRIWATANDGQGTIFHFTLPKHHEEGSNAEVAGI
jgi:PAS domain S-box-containing protein